MEYEIEKKKIDNIFMEQQSNNDIKQEKDAKKRKEILEKKRKICWRTGGSFIQNIIRQKWYSRISDDK